MRLIRGLEKISMIAASFVLGSVLYTNSLLAQGKMPEIEGKATRTEEITSKDGKIKIRVKDFKYKEKDMKSYLRQFSHYLVCGGVAEERPFSIFIVKDVFDFKTYELYLDKNRDGFVDPKNGKLKGRPLIDYIKKHKDGINVPLINRAPKCPTPL